MPWGDVTQYQGGSADTTRGPSPNVWGNVSVSQGMADPGVGWGFFDDFLTAYDLAAGSAITKLGPYVAIADTGGSLAGTLDVLGGAQNLVAGTTADADVTIQLGQGAGFVLGSAAASKKKLIFECRFKISTIVDNISSLFIGFTEEDRAVDVGLLAAAGTDIASIDAIGFFRPDSDGDGLDFIYRKAGQTTNIKIANLHTLVADTFVKAAFVFDPSNTANAIRAYINGVEDATAIADSVLDDTDFPDGEEMTMTMGVKNDDGSTASTMTVDWWRAFQYAV